jgi:hypothetical protein
MAKSSKGIPAHVPKTNEKWDGMPICLSKSPRSPHFKKSQGARSITSGASSIRSWDASSDNGSLGVPTRNIDTWTHASSPTHVSFRGHATGSPGVVPPGWDVVRPQSTEPPREASKDSSVKSASLRSLPVMQSQRLRGERSLVSINVPHLDTNSPTIASIDSPTTPVPHDLDDSRNVYSLESPMASLSVHNRKDIAPWDEPSVDPVSGSDEISLGSLHVGSESTSLEVPSQGTKARIPLPPKSRPLMPVSAMSPRVDANGSARPSLSASRSMPQMAGSVSMNGNPGALRPVQPDCHPPQDPRPPSNGLHLGRIQNLTEATEPTPERPSLRSRRRSRLNLFRR